MYSVLLVVVPMLLTLAIGLVVMAMR